MNDDAAPRITGYTIRGKAGALFVAHDDLLGRTVHIRLLPPRDAVTFLREARTIAGVEHPNLVRILGYGMADGRPYLIQQPVEGEPLTAADARDALRRIRPIVEALAAAWEKGITHGRIDRASIGVDKSGTARLSGFGEETSADFRDDIQALGRVLVEILTATRTQVPGMVATLVTKMMAADPELRHESYAMLLRDLDRVLAETASTLRDTAVPALQAPPPRKRLHWSVWVAAAVVLLGTIALVTLLHRHPSEQTKQPLTKTTPDTTLTVTAQR